MNSRLVGAFAVAVTTAASATMAYAQQNGLAAKNFDRGKHEYEAHCAVCQGLSGKGDGPFAVQLQTAAVVPDLTELSKKSNGVFPFRRLMKQLMASKL